MQCSVGSILKAECYKIDSKPVPKIWYFGKQSLLQKRVEAETKSPVQTSFNSLCPDHFEQFISNYEEFQKTLTGCCDPYECHTQPVLHNLYKINDCFENKFTSWKGILVGRQICLVCKSKLLSNNKQGPVEEIVDLENLFKKSLTLSTTTNEDTFTPNPADSLFLRNEEVIIRESQVGHVVPETYDYDEMNTLYKKCIQQHGTGVVENLRPLQAEAIHKLMLEKDVLCVLATNYGKTIPMVMPTFMQAALTNTKLICVIVTPLRTLMEDLSRKLTKWNLSGIVLSVEAIKNGSTDAFLDAIEQGKPAYILTSPETLYLKETRKLLSNRLVSHIMIDEVQTAVDWAPNFRSSFGELHDTRQYIDCGLGLFTGTLTHKMMDDLIKNTGLKRNNMELISGSPDRPEIYLKLKKRSKMEANLQFLVDDYIKHGLKMRRTIVFADSIEKTTDLNLTFRTMLEDQGAVYRNGVLYGYASDHFSSSTQLQTKRRIFKDFEDPNGIIRVLFSTISYGLGMDNPTVDRVVVYDTDKKATSLFQKIGRASRGGQKGTAVILGKFGDEDSMFPKKQCMRISIMSRFIGYKPVNIELRVSCQCKSEKCKCQACVCCTVCRLTCTCRKVKEDDVSDSDDDEESELEDESDIDMEIDY